MLVQCPLYPRFCGNKVHDVSGCHSKMEQYYGTTTVHGKRAYICPDCSLVAQCDYEQFYETHKDHLNQFTRSTKKQIMKENSSNSRSSSNATRKRHASTSMDELLQGGSNQQQQQQQAQQDGQQVPITVKYDLGKSYVDIRADMTGTPATQLRHVPSNVIARLESEVRKFQHCKVQYYALAEFENVHQDRKQWYLSHRAVPYSSDFITDIGEKLDEKIANYTEKGSGWRLIQIVTLGFIITKTSDVIYLSGRSYIPTPAALKQSLAVVNVENTDGYCFIYSILAVLKYTDVPRKHASRPKQYRQYFAELQYDENWMPMKLKTIPAFERRNPALSINVFRYNEVIDIPVDEEVYKNPHVDIIYRSRNPNGRPIYLLLLEQKEKYHYVAVTNLDRLLNMEHHHFIEKRIRCKWCPMCLHGFRSETSLEKHAVLCRQNSSGTTMYVMPAKKELRFKDWSKTDSPAYVVYADIEAILPQHNVYDQKHVPIAVGMLVVPIKATGQPQYYVFHGWNCLRDFLQQLETLVQTEIEPWYRANSTKPLIWADVDEQLRFAAADECYLCRKITLEQLVPDHDHFTGKFIGAACNECNLARRIRPFLPVVFHNFRGYDCHHILKWALNGFPHWELSIIPTTLEKYLSLTVRINRFQVRFLDSLQFLNESLAKLVTGLQDVPITSTQFPIHIARSKGIFPYNYAVSYERLQTTLELPPQWPGISETEYQKAQEVWTELGCTNLLEYMLQYMKLDVYLLADVFEAFRTKALHEDRLEPLNFYSIPGMSWASALISLDRDIELIQDPEMYRLFDVGIRGGMTFVNKHHVCAADTTSMLYIDINNLYGWALSQPLPYGSFEWVMDNAELDALLQGLLAAETGSSSSTGYLMEVDIMIPDELHDFLDQMPVAPISQCPPGSKVKKLLMTHEPKSNYIIHWRLLQFYMQLGVRVAKLHRAIRFKQAAIFKAYIDGNSEKRAAACSKFEKDYYKLKNNSLYGKTVENLKKRLNVRLCNNERKLVTYTSKAQFRRSMHIAEGLVAVLLNKEQVVLDRPSYIGQAVLDLSKLRMYELQYRDLARYRQMFQGSKISIMAGDTDSFFLKLQNIDREQLLRQMMEDGLLDTSNYPQNHVLYSNAITNKIGCFKDESEARVQYMEWIFLRPKCYSLLTDCGPKMRAKGVQLSQTSINHNTYRHVYEELGRSVAVSQTTIRSIEHQLFTMTNTKVALSCNDDKRSWVGQNKSWAYGHWRLR